jgi:quercetin dioxygenase-like cupin family protein
MPSERAGLVVGAGDGETTSSPLGGDVRFVVRGSDSGGALTALEVANPPGQGPPLHVHTAQDETIHVLDGELRWRLGDDLRSTGPGAYVFIPRGLPHCFQVMGERPGRMLITFAPAGMEAFFERLSTMTEFDAAEFRAAAEENGMRIVGPPLAESHPVA